LALAAMRIGAGEWDRAVVGGGEEHCSVVNEAHRRCGSGGIEGCAPFTGESGFVSGAGAVVFLLESKASLEHRGGKALGRVEKTASAFGSRARAARSVAQVLEQLDHPSHIVSSACGTWIDRAEAAAISRDNGAQSVTSIYGHIAETFSVTPLAGIAAVLLAGKLPQMLGGGSPLARGPTVEPVRSFAALCTDFSGPVSGVRIGIV
jgi:3-oxoacyl-(acyl-carrier-protein) synthase